MCLSPVSGVVPPCESTNPLCPLVWHCREGMPFWWFTPPFLVESYQELDYCSPMTTGLLRASQPCTMGRCLNQRYHTWFGVTPCELTHSLFVGTARFAPTIPQTRSGGVWVRFVVKTTWSPTAALTALHQSRSTARTGASTVTQSRDPEPYLYIPMPKFAHKTRATSWRWIVK